MDFVKQDQPPCKPVTNAPSVVGVGATVSGTSGTLGSATRPFAAAYNHPPYVLPMTSRPAESSVEDASCVKRLRKERACDLCRRKKIRCDFTQVYPDISCGSCRSYGKSCTFNEVAKKRGPPKGYVESLETRLRRMEELLINLVDSGKSLPEGCQDLLGKGTTNNSDIDGGTGLDEKTESNNRKVESIERKDHAHDSTSLAPSQSKKTSVETFRNSNSVSVEPAHGPVYSYFGGSSGVYFLAKFLGEDNSTVVPVTDDDVMISDRTSHFDQCASGQPILWRFPDKEIVDRLVNIYFERMNTLLPVIDEDEFKANYQKDMDSIWPPLLAAMCRAGSRLLEEDDSMLKKHNIGRNDLFHMFSKQIESNKTRVDILSPKIEFVQFLILLGNSTEKWGFNTQEWVVISMAAKMAQELGLHRASTGRRLSPRQAEQYRRLWWSAYSMDRWVSTAMGRPLSISDADCDVDFPAAEDGGHNYSFLVAITKLACILGDISRVLYSPRARTLWGENTKDADQICANFQRKLEEWRFSLPPHLRIYPDDEEQLRIGQLPAELEQRVNSGAGHLLAAYYSTMILLKQRSHDIDQSFLATEASRATYFSAENIIYVLGALRPNTVLVFSSVTTSFALFQSVGIILVGLTDPNAELVSKSKELIQKFKIICSRFSAYLPQDPERVGIVEDLERFVENAAATTIGERL